MPNCNDPKFPDRQVYANSVDPDQTPVPSGFICLHRFGSLCRKMIPIKKGGYSFSYNRICEENKRSPVMKKAVFAYAKTKTQ